MNLYIDPSEVKSLQYIDNFFYDTLIIGFKDGSRQKIRKFADIDWDLKDKYDELLKQIKK